MNEERIVRLLAADFAAESRVRERLRARLLGRPSRRAWTPRVAAWLSPALATAAVLLWLAAPRRKLPPPADSANLVDLRPRGRESAFETGGAASLFQTRVVTPEQLFGPPRGVVAVE